MQLNNNQITFCQEYVKNGNNGTQAYMIAYPECTYESARVLASQLLTNINIINYIKELQSKIEDDAILSIKDRMKWLSKVISNENREEVYLRDNEGKDTLIGSKNADLNTKLKAIDTLNKMDGVYTQRLEVKGNMQVNAYDELTADELRELIKNENKS